MNVNEALGAEITDKVIRVLHQGNPGLFGATEALPLDLTSLRKVILQVVTQCIKNLPLDPSVDTGTQRGLGPQGTTCLGGESAGDGALARRIVDVDVANTRGQYFRQGTDQWGSV